MSYTDEDLKAWEENFNAADKDGDKKISLSELPELMTKCGMKAPTEFKLKFVLKILDTNDDQKIDFEEFCQLTNPRLKVKLLQEFKKFLTEGRFLRRDDIIKVLMSISDSVCEKDVMDAVDEVMKDADKNKDGKIDHVEFMEYFMGKLEYK